MTGRYQVIKVLLKPVGEVTYEDDVPEPRCSLCMWSMSRLTSMFTPCKTCTTRGPEVPGATMQLVHRHGLYLGSGRCPHRARPAPHVALKCRGHDATCAWTWSMSRLRSTSTPCKTCTIPHVALKCRSHDATGLGTRQCRSLRQTSRLERKMRECYSSDL